MSKTPDNADNRERAVAPYRDSPPGKTALLIIDMISALDFPDADKVEADMLRATRSIAKLRAAADRQDVPVIYINDNFGEWHSERYRLVERALQDQRAVPIVSTLAPRDGDYFIIKPQFSGFYATNLPVLLPKLGVDRLVLTGMAADSCVLFTAADAHMRDYRLWIPSDAVAAQSSSRKRWSLETAHSILGAEIRPLAKLSLSRWRST
jgi:nicotinamidase-related amidase